MSPKSALASSAVEERACSRSSLAGCGSSGRRFMVVSSQGKNMKYEISMVVVMVSQG